MITGFLGNEIGDFTRRFPLVNIEVREDSNANAVKAVAAGDVDLSVFIANNELPCDTIDTVEYRSDRLVAVLPPNHPLSSRSSLTLEELLDLDFVAHHTTVITGIRRAAIGIGRELHVKFSVNTVESARSLVRAGLGVTVQPGCMLSVEDHAQLAAVPLAGDWAKLSHCIGTLRGRSLTAAAKALIDQLTSHASALHDTLPHSGADGERISTNPLAH
jgi:DNA-binding transcriptional LysR family regulator